MTAFVARGGVLQPDAAAALRRRRPWADGLPGGWKRTINSADIHRQDLK